MKAYARNLAARRRALLAQSAVQREQAAQATAGIRRGLTSVERGVDLVRQLARKPVVLGLGVVVAALFMAKPRQAMTWLGYGLTAYTMFRRARSLLSSQDGS